MALVLVRLKLALLRAGLVRAQIRGVIGFAFSIVLAVGFGLLGAFPFALTRAASDEAAGEWAIVGFSVVFAVWVLGPVVTAASDGTLPPERLAPFPLSPRQLMSGLLAASAVGFGGLCTVLVLAGAVVGLAPASPAAVLTVAAVAFELMVCVTFSRLFGTAISSAARRRRGRDVALLVGPLVAVAANLGVQISMRATIDPARPGAVDLSAWRAVRPVLLALPSGAPAAAAAFARQGRIAAAVGALALSAAFVLVGLRLWHVVLQSALTSAGGEGPDPEKRGRALFPWFARFLPHNRLGAVAARELRLSWRDPRQRAALLGSLMAPVIMIVSMRTLTSSNPAIVLFGALPATFIALGAVNLWGFDGRAAWIDLLAPGDPRDDVVGKVVAKSLVAGVLTPAAVAVLALRAGSAARVADTVALAVGSFAFAMGAAVVVATRWPQAMPDSRTNVFSAGNSGQGLTALAFTFVTALVLVPFGFLLGIASSTPVRAALCVTLLLGGLTVLAIGVTVAGNRLRGHGPEFLEELSAE